MTRLASAPLKLVHDLGQVQQYALGLTTLLGLEVLEQSPSLVDEAAALSFEGPAPVLGECHIHGAPVRHGPGTPDRATAFEAVEDLSGRGGRNPDPLRKPADRFPAARKRLDQLVLGQREAVLEPAGPGARTTHGGDEALPSLVETLELRCAEVVVRALDAGSL